MSSNDCKKILLFINKNKSRSEYRNFIETIESDLWRLTEIDDFDSAKKVIFEDNYRVGIVLITQHQPEFLLCVKDLTSSNKFMNWIALIDDTTLHNPIVQEMIVDQFYDYHRLPVSQHRLLTILGHAYGMSELAHSTMKNYDELIQKNYIFGKSLTMQNVRQQIIKMAVVDKTVLISGESGTGKELAARALHQISNRSTRPWVTVNTAALPTNLIHSELFGHEKGAFTGAHRAKIGKIESANEGTIFLDEIGDITPDVQVALLRFLQEKTIERVGNNDSINLNVRVISATHRDLKEAIVKGQFREDLYYRLNALHLNIPPLRERGDDITDLAHLFFEKYAREQKKSKPKDFSSESLQLMSIYPWPGNVRELINRVERAVLLCDNNLVSPMDLELDKRNNLRHVTTIEEARRKAEHSAIHNAIQYTHGNMTKAAEILGISRASLYRLLRIHDENSDSSTVYVEPDKPGASYKSNRLI